MTPPWRKPKSAGTRALPVFPVADAGPTGGPGTRSPPFPRSVPPGQLALSHARPLPNHRGRQVPQSFPALAPLCRPPAPRSAGARLAERGCRLCWQRVSVWEGDRQADGQTWTVWAVVFLGSISPGRSPAGHRLQHSACPDRRLHRGRDTGCQRTREDLEGEWGGVRGLPGAVGDGGDERNVPWARSEGNKGRSKGHRASLQGTWPLPV